MTDGPAARLRAAGLRVTPHRIAVLDALAGLGGHRTADEVAGALEMADVLLYLVRLADKLDIDLNAAAVRKIGLNAVKYPVDQFRGSSRKYDEPA